MYHVLPDQGLQFMSFPAGRVHAQENTITRRAAVADVASCMLQVLSGQSGASLGYGFATRSLDDDSPDDSDSDRYAAMLETAVGAT